MYKHKSTHEMYKHKSNATERAWHLVRAVLLWSRKGRVYRRRLMMDFCMLPKLLKSTLGNSNRRGAVPYGERQLSVDKTPIRHVKMHRPSMWFKMPHIPCINPQAEFEHNYDYYNDDAISYCNEEESRRSFLMSPEDDKIKCETDDEIDVKAEEFIANFYEQMKLQRQISYLQYNEMLDRGTN